MASNCTPETEMDTFLKEIRLGKYREHILKLGVEELEDLQDIKEDELVKMGMKSVEIERFKRKVNEEIRMESPMSPKLRPQTPGLPFSPITVNPEKVKKIISQRSTRSNLRISYQLMTELKPQVNHLSAPFDSEKLHYFDLVNMICEQERTILGKNLTIELYTCEGYPLAINPSCYISKLSDWCLETYDTILLYAIPRPKIFTKTDENYFKKSATQDGNANEDVIYIQNEQVGFGPIPVGVNCNKVKVKELTNIIHQMTSLPPTCFTLKVISKNVKLEIRERTLKEYNIKDQSVIEIIPESEFWLSSWDQNFFVGACLATWNDSQTVYGTSLFFASLYTLSIWIRKQSVDIPANVLGHIRSITGCAPLIHALKILFNKECLSLPHRVAIQEVMMLVFKSIGPKQLKGDAKSYITIPENKILQESTKFWSYFIEYAKDFHSRTEEYSNFNLCCSIKNNRMIDPKRVMDSQGIPHIVDKTSCTGKIKNEMFEPLPEYVRMIKSFSGFEAQVWKEKDMVITEVDLTREWNTIESKWSKIPFLCIQLPLAVKDSHSCPIPCMILGENGMVCNYIGGSKDEGKPYEGFDPLGGNTFNFDADDLDETLRKGKFPQFAELIKSPGIIATNTTVDLTTITRPLNEIEEIIMVVLDTSGSMDSQYFANKSKYELAMTGFEQFCNRTTAYNYKNMIGLVIFGSDSKLELQLTESFRHFSKEIKSFPNKRCTAIYDAIIFTIKYINSFKVNHGFPNTLPTRILCLTDGGDNASKTSPVNASNSLICNNIVMDSVLLCNGKVKTHGIAKLSGGLSFQPNDQKELSKIFEFETMLNLACRKYKTRLEYTLEEALLIPFDTDPEFLHPNKLASTFQTSEKCLANAVIHKIVSSQVNAEVTKRILKELAYLQTNPHPEFEVFPCSDAVDFWHLMLEAPAGTPYEHGIFCLYVEFTKDYPNKAPNIRFITPIYHCNINSAGRICHKVLDRFYSPEMKIRELLNHVYGLLLEATPDDPLDSYKAALLSSNKHEYEREAILFTQTHARNKMKTDVRIEILGGNPDIRNCYHKQFTCPLTLSLFKEPVITCHGQTYEKEAIEEYLDNVANQDPFSFKSLSKEQLVPNYAIIEGVEEFRSKLSAL